MENEKTDWRNIFICALMGVGSTLIFSIATALIVCGALMSSADPASMLTPIAFAVLLISSVVGGIVGSLKSESPLFSALICSLLHLALLLPISMMLASGESDVGVPTKLILYAAVPLLSVGSAYLMSNRSNRRKRSKSRKRKYK